MATTETVHRKQLVNNMYPIEQFASGLLEDVTFFPNVGECIYYRLNPALAAGTSYFKSGFYRPGKLMAISNSNGGKLFQVMDDKDGRVHEVNRYQIKQA